VRRKDKRLDSEKPLGLDSCVFVKTPNNKPNQADKSYPPPSKNPITLTKDKWMGWGWDLNVRNSRKNHCHSNSKALRKKCEILTKERVCRTEEMLQFMPYHLD
jgi:hypothetical protein